MMIIVFTHRKISRIPNIIKLSLKSISISISIETELVLFPFDPSMHPPTHQPAGKVSIKKQKDWLKTPLGLIL